jgi:carbamoyltransferase
MARELKELTGSENLCFAGGVALNCVANRRLIEESGFKRVFIPLDPGDGGAAVGAALWDGARGPASSTYGIAQGTSLSPEQVALEKATLDELIALGPVEGTRWKVTRFGEGADGESELLARAAEAIADGRILGWFQGRQELGPRSLGHRSILIRPDLPELARKLSREVKKRAPYRPYALSMSGEAAERILENARSELPAQRWMQTSAPVRESLRASVRAGLHSDGTTRPQICLPGDNPLYARLLDRVGALTGLAAVVNTSFNERGYPMAATAIEAYAQFARTAMDVLVIENIWIEKERKVP